jgi:hypothetical protein
VQLVVSASYHLLPRFVRAGTATPTNLPIVLGGINVGVVALVIAAVAGIASLAPAGVLVLAVSATLYAYELRRILLTSPSKKPDLTLRHWWMITACTIALAALGAAWALGLSPVPSQRVAAAAVILTVFGWLTLAIMGQLYKITPFLIWHYRFARGLGPEAVSRLPTPYHPQQGVAPMALTLTGSTALATAALLGNPPLAVGGGMAFLAGTIGFWWVMAGSWLPRLIGRTWMRRRAPYRSIR